MKIYPINTTYTEVQSNEKCFGIDLGTTYSLMAQVDASYVDLTKSSKIPVHFIRFKQQSPDPFDPAIEDEKVASIVAFLNNKPFIGNNLYHLKGRDNIEFRKNIFYHWKVEMGVDHHPMYPDAVSEKLDMPYKVAGVILKYMRAMHLNDPYQPLNNSIITVPASFQANQRQDTLKAAEIAQIATHQQMLIDEPNAAFLGYFNRLSEEKRKNWAQQIQNKNILVIDFGGGTLDLSILNVNFSSTDGIMLTNKAISRYNDLGGQDLDYLIAEQFLYPKLEKKFADVTNLTTTELQCHILPQLFVLGEKLKKGICEKVSLNTLDNDPRNLDLTEQKFILENCKIKYKNDIYDLDEVQITAEEFNQLFAKLFQGKNFSFNFIDKTVTTISSSINELLEKSNVYLNELNYVLYVGGSSFNPFLQSYVSEKLPNTEHLTSHEPDKLVAEGAAVFSYFYHTHGLSLIKPITSDAIGIRTKGNKFKQIIGNGCQLPIKIALTDFTLQSNLQDEIVVPVCINSIDFPIGEMRCTIDDFYPPDTTVTIEASLNEDKVFEISVLIGGENVGTAFFNNPYSTGMVTPEQHELFQLKSQLNQAKYKRNKQEEKKYLRELIWKHSEVNNHLGVIETAEEYISKFDDQDADIWNLIYCHNSRQGRHQAAKKALEKALIINPKDSSYIYNYAITLNDKDAFEYLSSQADWIQASSIVSIKLVLLQKKLGKDWEIEAKKIIEKYKNSPDRFSDFDKRVLLPTLFQALQEPYSYVDPKKAKNTSDEKSYLTTKE